jgi:hypothetical protein
MPNPMETAFSAPVVWVAGENDVWLGGAKIWHWDGAAWSESSQMSAVHFWGFSPTDIWATNESRVARWDGSTWTDVPASAGVTMTALWRIWGTSDSDIYVANQDNSRVYHYNGTAWTVTTLQFVMVEAIWGSSANDIWLSGTFDLWHYNGTWTKYAGNDEPTSVNGIWGFAANDVWAASDFDGVSHWNGSAWTDEMLDEDYDAIWGSGPNNIYAVGGHGAVAHFDGNDWRESSELNIQTNFYSLHGSSPTNIWATAVNLREQKTLVYKRE